MGNIDKKEKFEYTKNVVESLLSVNILINSRERKNVDARMIYCKIMRNSGYTLSEIGESISKHHSTIVHYMKQFEVLYEFDNSVKDSYDKCANALRLSS